MARPRARREVGEGGESLRSRRDVTEQLNTDTSSRERAGSCIIAISEVRP